MTRGVHGSGYGGFTLRENPKEYYKAYNYKNKERISIRQKKRYDANPEKYRAMRRAYYYKKLAEAREKEQK